MSNMFAVLNIDTDSQIKAAYADTPDEWTAVQMCEYADKVSKYR